jgi:putative aldouronate transport system permease protein
MNAILYVNDSAKWPIQILLRQIVIVSSGLQADGMAVDIIPPAQTVKMAVIVIATVPMLIVYPFVQKYFVKGALVGSVKG